MKLAYRGTAYENDLPTIDMMEGEVGGKYRGQSWQCRYPRHIPVPQPAVDLKYRGVPYCTYPQAASEITPAKTLLNLGGSRKVSHELEEAHLANIRRRLQHRLQVAKSLGDENLIQMLEAESKQLVGNSR